MQLEGASATVNLRKMHFLGLKCCKNKIIVENLPPPPFKKPDKSSVGPNQDDYSPHGWNLTQNPGLEENTLTYLLKY